MLSKDIENVIALEKLVLSNLEQPNLLVLSCVLGCLEKAAVNKSSIFPIRVSDIQPLVSEFERRTSTWKHTTKGDLRSIIQTAANLVWDGLEKKDKDQPHVQYLGSWLGSSRGKGRLDCFGICTAVLSILHAWGLDEHVWLTLSEDHAWLSFWQADVTAKDTKSCPITCVDKVLHVATGTTLETAEVSWADAKLRGQSVKHDHACWVYQAGHGVLASPSTLVAALVSNINSRVGKGFSAELGESFFSWSHIMSRPCCQARFNIDYCRPSFKLASSTPTH